MQMIEENSRESFLKAIRPGAEEVGGWKYLMQEHRFTLVRLFFEFFRERPLFTVFTGLFVFDPSILGIANMILALGVNQIWNELMGQLEVMNNQFKVFKGGLLAIVQNDPELTVKRLKVSRYLPPFSYHDISYFLVEAFQKMIPYLRKKPFELDDQLEVFAINSEKGILINVSTYPAPFRQSYIIFDHEPEECGPFQRFAILHEVGHVVLGPVKNSYFARHGFKTMLFSLGLAFFCFHLTYQAWILILFYYILGYWERLYLSYTGDVRDEINCDIFALDYLAHEDLTSLARVSNLPELLNDSSLTTKHNQHRISNLTRGLKLKSQNPEVELHDLLKLDKRINYKPNFFRVLVMVFSLGAIAFFISVKSWATITLLIFLILIIIAFVVSHIYSMANTRSLFAFLARYEE